MNFRQQLLVCAISAVLSGCSSIRDLTMPSDKDLLSGAGSLMSQDSKFEVLDLKTLIDEYKLSSVTSEASTALTFSGNEEVNKYRRNELQYRIIAASNQRCGYYLRLLVASKSQTQLGWGGLATLLSGAASVVGHAPTAAALAAGSTVSNGYLSLYNEAYFNNLTVNVISAGIAKQREGIQSQIATQRDSSLVDYPVNRAIADALAYHASCNIISGLEAAAVATKDAEASKIAPNLLGVTLSSAQQTAATAAQARVAQKVNVPPLPPSPAVIVPLAPASIPAPAVPAEGAASGANKKN